MIIKADWTDFKLAEANNNLNKGYFKTGEYKNFPSYYKMKEALLWIIEQEQSKLTMLDIGCGTGWQAEYLRVENLLQSIDYVGSDISEHMVSFASQNCPDLSFITLDIISELAQPFDIVSESAVLELIDWEKALVNMILSSKKWIILHRMYFIDDKTFAEQVSTYNNIPDIRYHIGLNDLNNVLIPNGFSVVKKDVWHTGVYNMGTFICKRGAQ